MSLRRKIIRILDRTGFRWVLSLGGTAYYRRKTGLDCNLFWDGSWFSRIQDVTVSDGFRFDYCAEILVERLNRLNESREYWYHRYTPTSGDTVIDVGAGNGIDTILFSRSVGPTGRVFAIEAHPRTFERLKKVCQYNELKNVVVKNLAIVDKVGTAEIEDRDDDQANRIITVPSDHGILVDTTTLDMFCSEEHIDHVDFLKMNIEGAEQWAILGMSTTLGKAKAVVIACHDFCAVEAFDERYCTRETVKSFLASRAFLVTDRRDDARPWVRDHLHATRLSKSNPKMD